jgi:hypothetical protein
MVDGDPTPVDGRFIPVDPLIYCIGFQPRWCRILQPSTVNPQYVVVWTTPNIVWIIPVFETKFTMFLPKQPARWCPPVERLLVYKATNPVN